MTNIITTLITIAFVHKDGRIQNLGIGEIDATGKINITNADEGMEEYLKDRVDELNSRDYIIVKEPPPVDAPRFSIGKRKIFRDDPEFIIELANYAERVYALKLDFDSSLFEVKSFKQNLLPENRLENE